MNLIRERAVRGLIHNVQNRGVTDVGETLVAFRIRQLLFGLPVDIVQRVIPACEVSPLPDAPPVVRGIIRFDGDILPVIDPHRPFNNGLSTSLRVASVFIIVQSLRRRLAIIADQIDGTQVVPQSTLRGADHLTTGLALIREIGATPHGLIYIYDVEHLLLEEDDTALSAALDKLPQ